MDMPCQIKSDSRVSFRAMVCLHAYNLPSSSWLYFCLDIRGLAPLSKVDTWKVMKGKLNACMYVHCREELMSYQREIEVLSEQYSQKCLENAHLAHALEAERQALRQCQRENQELNAHNQVTMAIDLKGESVTFCIPSGTKQNCKNNHAALSVIGK